MGVRFQCPNGHALHVKANLAGKRGICPKCDARFIVPSFSTLPASAAAGGPISPDALSINASESAKSGSAATAAVSTQLAQTPINPFPDAAARQGATDIEPRQSQPAAKTSLSPQWYVRPRNGGQYGPATTDEFRMWVAEGRVGDASLVWRTGWSEWKLGRVAIAFLEDASSATADETSVDPLVMNRDPTQILDQPLREEAVHDVDADVSVDIAAQPQAGSAAAHRADLRRRKQRATRITVWLALATVLLAAILLVVVNR